MNHRRFAGFAGLVGLVALLLVGCGGSSETSGTPIAPGAATLDRSGATVTMSGQLAFTDETGATIAGPAGGALVFAGTGTLGTGTARNGAFLIRNLPNGVALLCIIAAQGFLPRFLEIPAGATSLPEGTLKLQKDTNPADDPVVEHVRCFRNANDSYLVGDFPNGVGDSRLVVFGSDNPDVSRFTGHSGAVLETHLNPVGDRTYFSTPLGANVSTGALFACLFSPTKGMANANIIKCILKRPHVTLAEGTTVNGTVFDAGGAALVGARVELWEEATPANGTAATSNLVGRFSANFPARPVGTFAVSVYWEDPVTGQRIYCVFRNYTSDSG